MFHHIPDIAARVLEGHGEAVAHVVFAIAGSGAINSDDQRFEAGIFCAFDELMRERAVGPHVELEPQTRAGYGLGDFFHRGLRAGGQCEGDAGGGGGFGQRDFTLIPEQAGGAGRRDADRHLVLVAEKFNFLIAFGNVDQSARLEFDALKRLAVVAQPDFVFGAAVDEFEHTLGGAPHRHFTQVENIVCAQCRITHDASLTVILSQADFAMASVS